MYDHQPNPGDEGRVLITPEDTSIVPFYARVSMADNPLHMGTPISKRTMLQDATAALFGLDADAVPDDVLKILSNAALAGSEDGVLETALGKKVGVRIMAGSYVGTGTYGSNNPNVLTFDSKPILVMIFAPEGQPTIFARGQTKASTWDNVYASGGVVSITWGDKTVRWYALDESWSGASWVSNGESETKQLNKSGTRYGYISVCV